MLVYLTKHEVVNENLNSISGCKNLPLFLTYYDKVIWNEDYLYQNDVSILDQISAKSCSKSKRKKILLADSPDYAVTSDKLCRM